MLGALLDRVMDAKQKRALKAKINKARVRLIRTFYSYDAEDLKRALRSAGITETDTLLVHSNFEADSGFQGTPADVVEALCELVGEKGNLLMVSIPFRGSGYDYLEKGKPFKVLKTMSMMGLITEMFRRREGTLRSVHPTHPVLAIGKDAEWLVEGHERCRYPCGPDSPFDKFRSLHGKILFYDVSFGAITFFHHVEDLLKDRVPFPVYAEKEFSIQAIDAHGNEHTVRTVTFEPGLTRSAAKLEAAMEEKGLIRHGRVGNSRYLLVDADDVVECHTAMVDAGNYPYDLS